MAVRPARKPQRSSSRAKRDHVRTNGRSGAKTRRTATSASSQRAQTAKRSFVRKKTTRKSSSDRAPASSVLSGVGRGLGQLVTTAAALAFLSALAIGWGYLQYLPQSFSAESSQFVAMVPSSTDSTEETVYVAWLGGSVQQSRIWQLPASLPVELPESYGEYRLGSVYPLLTLDERSPHFIDAILTRSVGAVIATHVPLDPAQAGLPLKDRAWHEFVVAARTLEFAQAKTALQIWYIARQEALQQEFTELSAVQKAVQNVRKSVYPPECQVAVLNASATAGEATALSKILELNGITAIRVDTFSEQRSESSLYVDGQVSAGCDSVVAVLQSIFTKSEGIVPEENAQITTQNHAPIVVVVGDTF